jgi:hypothetical protein
MRALLPVAALVATVTVAGLARAATTDPISIVDQTDGVNSKRVTKVALYCHKDPCAGKVALTAHSVKMATGRFSIKPKTTGKVSLKLTKPGFAMVKRAPKRKLKATVSVTTASGQVFTHRITLSA